MGPKQIQLHVHSGHEIILITRMNQITLSKMVSSMHLCQFSLDLLTAQSDDTQVPKDISKTFDK